MKARGGTSPVRWMVAVGAVALVIATAAAGCRGDDAPGDDATDRAAPRPLTSAESKRLASMRFTNFDTGVRAVQFEVTDSGHNYEVDGWVDFGVWLGYARLSDGDQNSALIAWTKQAISSHDPVGDEDTPPPIPAPDTTTDAWVSSDLAPDESRLHAVLAIILMATYDRPDNPLLLQQTDARWLRTDELDGVPVDVVAGPTSDEPADVETSASGGSDATVRYWIDRDSVLMRLEVRLGGHGWTTVDFTDASGVAFADDFRADG